MRLVIHALGIQLLDLELTTTDPEPDEDPAAALNGGSTGVAIVGFGVREDEVGLPDRDYT